MENTSEQPQIKLSDTTEVFCTCGSKVFLPSLTLRGVSALLSGTGKNEVIPLQDKIICAKCQEPYTPPKLIVPSPTIIS